MKDLEFFYQMPLKSAKFIDRKQNIVSAKTIVSGAIKSGKTAMLCEYLSRFKQDERLYLNLKDLRINASKILQNLKDFIEQNSQIKALGIDNVASQDELEILKDIQNLALESIVVTTEQIGLRLDGFALLRLNYLDYEEFMLFFRKNLDEQMLFSHFLAHGGTIKSAFLEPGEIGESLQNGIRRSLSPTNLAILQECALRCAEPVSAYEIYKSLKERIKISKDSVYSGANELEGRGLISFAAKFGEPNATKRLFFNDFAMRNALNLKKDFAKLFSNVVFCELLKFDEPIFYTKEFDFFLYKRKLAIICMPFSDNDLVFLRFKKLHSVLKNLGVVRLQIISVTNFGEMTIEGIRCEILPFTRWALGIG